jgi:hypothetical protein
MIPASPSSHKQIEPMTLGSMRRLGARSLAVSCRTCHHETVINADHWPGQMRVPSFWSRMVCGNCGTLGADARPATTPLARPASDLAIGAPRPE